MATLTEADKAARAALEEGESYATDAPYEFDANETYHEIVYREEWKKHRSDSYWAYRKAWEDVPRNKLETDFPIHLDIETTNICNLKCPMCPRTLYVEQNDPNYTEPGMMTREEYAGIIDQGMAHGLKSIKLNYLNEPLAHKDAIWHVEYAKKKGVLDVMMNTNATLLDKRRGKALLEAGIDNVFVSFDAAAPDLYEQQRVGTTLGKVIDNVHEFVKLRNAGYPHVQVRVSMVMYKTAEWLEQFEGVKIMWKRLVDSVGYGFYIERDRNAMGEYPEVKSFWCAQPYQRMFLKFNGNVTICCVDDKDETIVGNWRTQKLRDIWNGEAFREIRRLHSEGRYYEMGMCRKCYMPVSK